MQYYNGGGMTTSGLYTRFKPLHDPISEAQSKDEFSLYTDLISSQQMNYSISKQILQFDKKNKQNNGSNIDLIKMNGMHNSLDMSQRLIGSQIYTNNNNLNNNQNSNIISNSNSNLINLNKLLINHNHNNSSNNMEELNFQNTPKNIIHQNLTQGGGETSLNIQNSHENNSNAGIEVNEKVSTNYDPSNNNATKPTLNFLNQNIIAPIAYSNNFNSNEQLNSEEDQQDMSSLDKKMRGKKSIYNKENKQNNQEEQDAEMIFMNCPHCQKEISFIIQNNNNNQNKNCGNVLHRMFSMCYSCTCNHSSTSSQPHQPCPECKKEINLNAHS